MKQIQNKLTIDQFNRFIFNLYFNKYYVDKINKIRTLDESLLHEFINQAFIWECTPEGDNYWHRIYNKLYHERVREKTI